MNKLFSTALLCLCTTFAFGQSHKELIQKKWNIQNPQDKVLVIANVNGHVDVEGYEGSSIQMDIEKRFQAKSEKKLKAAMKRIQLNFREEGDTIIAYFEIKCNSEKGDWSGKGIWKYYSGTSNSYCQHDDDYQFNFKVKVPKEITLWLATINNGNVKVKNTQGEINVENINGSIRLDDIAGKTRASTINGSLDVRYTNTPRADSRYYALNGDINAYYPKGLSAVLAFKSFNGELFTNVEDIEQLPKQLKKLDNNNGTTYKIERDALLNIRNGQTLLDFETFNGDVYLREL
ncbi:MAG: hypothetical protein AAF990_20665 [Bacteroidota bacterium]